MITFYTQWKRPDKTSFYEKVDDTKIVETSGYLSAKKRIENMIIAGQRLVAFRKEQYDFQYNEEVDLTFNDPTRSPGFDVSDATQIALNLAENKGEPVENNQSDSVQDETSTPADPTSVADSPAGVPETPVSTD